MRAFHEEKTLSYIEISALTGAIHNVFELKNRIGVNLTHDCDSDSGNQCSAGTRIRTIARIASFVSYPTNRQTRDSFAIMNANQTVVRLADRIQGFMTQMES